MGSIFFGMVIGFIVWFLVRCLAAGFYTVNQNERAVKTTIPCGVLVFADGHQHRVRPSGRVIRLRCAPARRAICQS